MDFRNVGMIDMQANLKHVIRIKTKYVINGLTQRRIWNTYEVWLWSVRNNFIASLIPVQLTERGHLQSTSLGQQCT